ncbi:hypothetical protein TNCV_4425571 [Trichonephila clavipes]|nr:hypothetical protein TNCV_4425571 [Trichonephila clavipes]
MNESGSSKALELRIQLMYIRSDSQSDGQNFCCVLTAISYVDFNNASPKDSCTLRADVKGVAHTHMSSITFQRRLREWILRSHQPLRSLPLTSVHRQVRLQWYKASSESRFQLCHDDNHNSVLK